MNFEMKTNITKKGTRKEAFIKHASKTPNKYVAGQSERASANYEDNVRELLSKIKNKEIRTVETAKEFVRSRA